MEDLRVIYRILRYIHESMDNEEFDAEHFTAQSFGISEQKFRNLLGMLVESGYIKGVPVSGGRRIVGYKLVRPRLTLEGLQYLADNSIMRKIADATKGIADILS